MIKIRVKWEMMSLKNFDKKYVDVAQLCHMRVANLAWKLKKTD